MDPDKDREGFWGSGLMLVDSEGRQKALTPKNESF